MMFRNLILSCALALGIVVAGCNENPTIAPDPVITGLGASSLTPTSVALAWNSFSGASTYNVAWTGPSSGGLTGISTTTATATNLAPGQEYTFTVTGVDAAGAVISTSSSSIKWAGAERHNDVEGSSTTRIRMYEHASPRPSGVNLSAGAGPTNVSLKANTPGVAQLAMYVDPKEGGNPNKIVVGPVYAITEYKVSAASDPNKVDQNVFISATTTKDLTSLDTWYMSTNLEAQIDPGSNIKAYEFLSPVQTGNGFVVRTGTAGNYHYARVLIKSDATGKILQGGFPDRYVELEVSYQRNAGVPYAKGVVGRPGVPATAGH